MGTLQVGPLHCIWLQQRPSTRSQVSNHSSSSSSMRCTPSLPTHTRSSGSTDTTHAFPSRQAASTTRGVARGLRLHRTGQAGACGVLHAAPSRPWHLPSISAAIKTCEAAAVCKSLGAAVLLQ